MHVPPTHAQVDSPHNFMLSKWLDCIHLRVHFLSNANSSEVISKKAKMDQLQSEGIVNMLRNEQW